jgi:uncharacterized membrane protein
MEGSEEPSPSTRLPTTPGPTWPGRRREDAGATVAASGSLVRRHTRRYNGRLVVLVRAGPRPMRTLPIVLILVSCFAHASWNLLARHRGDELRFFGRMLLMTVPLAAPVVGLGLLLPHAVPARVLLYVVPSGIVSGLYFRFLALAYGSSDFTVVYPVARALPVLVVAAVDVLRGRPPTAAGLAGMLLVVAGCVLAPQTSYRNLRLAHYRTKSLAWIVLTAATIVAFTVLDKLAAEIVGPGAGSAAIYCALYMASACATYAACQALFDRGRPATGEVGWRMPAAGAALTYTSYTLVLWAFQLAPQASYLLAFRQFSLVLGVAAAFAIHREEGLAVRLPATGAIVAGLVMLTVWG